jgi:dienelactone hydrolase
MVGYGDTHQAGPHRQFALDPTNQLWNVSLMGLQTWNGVRALDFLESLQDADRSRLGCTGASGGGTQTFMLGAIDDRLTAVAPIVMVSHSMQGGCLCENAPGLRVEFSNMELSASAAPRPQLLVAATGDWTKTTPTVEGPAIAGIYRLFGREHDLRFARFDFPHNYNRTTREEVYRWFNHRLLGEAESAAIREAPYTKEPDEALRVWGQGGPPPDAVNADALVAQWIDRAKERLRRLTPRDAEGLQRYGEAIRPLWRHALQLELPEQNLIVETDEPRSLNGATLTNLRLGRSGRGDRVEACMISSRDTRLKHLVILAHPEGRAAYLDARGNPVGLAADLIGRGATVLLADLFNTGTEPLKRDYFADYFTTYNRTDAQERVQDLVTLCAFAHRHAKGRKVVLCGIGRAGYWTLLAAPAADAAVADAGGANLLDREFWLERDVFAPGLGLLGGFDGAAALAAPQGLLLHHAGESFPTPLLEAAYKAAGREDAFQRKTARLGDDAVVQWISELR